MAVQKLMEIDAGLVQKMALILPRQTAEELQDHFGISVSALYKLRNVIAILQSVARRLLARLEHVIAK